MPESRRWIDLSYLSFVLADGVGTHFTQRITRRFRNVLGRCFSVAYCSEVEVFEGKQGKKQRKKTRKKPVNLCLTLEIIQMGTDRPQDFTGISILPNESHSVWQYNPLTHPRCGCTPDVFSPAHSNTRTPALFLCPHPQPRGTKALASP